METTTKMTGKQLLDAALPLVESASIRKWATEGKNGRIWLQIATGAAKKGKRDAHAFAAYIVCVAMGA